MKVLVSSSQCAWLKGLWLQAGEPGTGESFLWETQDWAWLRGCPGGAGQMEQATRQEVCPGWPGGFPVWLGHWSFWALGFSEEVIGRSEDWRVRACLWACPPRVSTWSPGSSSSCVSTLLDSCVLHLALFYHRQNNHVGILGKFFANF